MNIVECLMKIGFTRHESSLYITLCKEGDLTGYECAKISGISRSNVYLALSGLVEKGGARRIEIEAVKYSAVLPEELVFNLKNNLAEVFDYIVKDIPVQDNTSDPYITVTGKKHIVNKMKYIINNAAERIYLSMSPRELSLVENEILSARDKGLKIVIITSTSFEMEGVIIHYSEKSPGQIRLIADTSHAFTGDISEGEDSACLYSKNKNLIQLIKDSLTNEIKLILTQNKE